MRIRLPLRAGIEGIAASDAEDAPLSASAASSVGLGLEDGQGRRQCNRRRQLSSDFQQFIKKSELLS
ncbi:MAG: hypothetical protein CME86_12760 [Herbaspirillum sp.]|nr:hypothetical protein [Herbaspirillum sp.]MBO16309.1 hypothetical protein [Herbaspirillum sp.]